MGLYTALPDVIQEVDVIIVGGGTAGCVIAARIADADPHLSVLVIEAGPDNYKSPTITNPGLSRATFVPDNPSWVVHMGNKEEQLLGREVPVIVGGVLGGGSSVNGMIYARGQSVDYDSWGAKGWSGDEVLPFLQKFETFYGQGNGEHHGNSGPVKVSRGLYRGEKIEKDFVTAMSSMGYPVVEDLQDLRTANGVSPLHRYVSPEDGKRQDSAHAYLHPRLQDGNHPNLHVLVGSQVTRVLLNQSNTVTGIEYRLNPRCHANSVDKPTRTVQARKLVIISAGTFATPSLLERSGIGNPEVLDRAGVPVLHILPGVGHDYQDHLCSLYTYKSRSTPADSWESIYNGTRNIPEMLATSDKILSWNGIDASAKIRPTTLEVEYLGPRFKEAWNKDFKDIPSKPLVSMILVSGILGDPRPFPKGEYFTICSYTTYPYSRGHIHIKSPDIDDPLDFRTGYASDPDNIDLKTQIWAYKKQREVARRMKFFHSELASQHPTFTQRSSASCITEASERAPEIDLEYSNKDDKAIEHFVRGHVGTTWHPLGTCKMAPAEHMGVVDEILSVHGVLGLKIADMSIAPNNVSGNTMSTALLIGEKAAELVIEQLGLRNEAHKSK